MANRRPLVLVDGRRKEIPRVDRLAGSLIEAYQGRNHVINGGLDLWQRGISSNLAGYQTVDRFINNYANGSQSTLSRIALSSEDFPAGVFSPSYAMRLVINANGGASSYITIQHRIENLARFGARDMHFGIWVRVNTAGLKVVFEATADPGAGGSTNGNMSSTIGVKTFTIAQANTWTFCPNPFTMPSVRGFTINSPELSSLRYNLWLSAGSDSSSRNQALGFQPVNSQFDFAMPQMEYGTADTPFEVSPMSAIVAACQRYYEKSFALNVAPAQNAGGAGARPITQVVSAGTSQFGCNIPYKVEKRINPAVVLYNPNANNAFARNANTGADCTSTGVGAESNSSNMVLAITTAAGSSPGQNNIIHFSADAEI